MSEALGDRRIPPFLWVSNEAMEILLERDDVRAAWLYVVLAHMASEARDGAHAGFVCPKRKLIDRVGMTKNTVSTKLDMLVEMGLLSVERQTTSGGRDTASVYILLDTPKGSAVDPQIGGEGSMVDPQIDPQIDPSNARASRDGKEVKEDGGQVDLGVDETRVDRFIEVHAKRVVARGARRPKKTKAELQAARDILAEEPDSQRILARLDFALRHPYLSGRVKTMIEFRDNWDDIALRWQAAEGSHSGGPHKAPSPPPNKFSATNLMRND